MPFRNHDHVITSLTALLFLVLISGPVQGQVTREERNGLPDFLRQRSVSTIDGSVVTYSWTNPVAFFELAEDVEDESSIWTVQLGSPAELVALGWSGDTLATGEAVRLTTIPSGESRTTSGLVVVATADGRELLNLDHATIARANRQLDALGAAKIDVPTGSTPSDDMISALASRAGLPAQEALIGTWLLLNPSGILAASPLLNDDGKARAAETAGFQGFLAAMAQRSACRPDSPPQSLASRRGVRGFEMRGGDIVILDPSMGDTDRVIKLGTSTHGSSDPDDRQGDSIGRWEGDTLVVETVFNSGEDGEIIPGVPFDGTILEERFTLTANRTHVAYGYAIRNPGYLLMPLTDSVGWVFLPDVDVPRLPCDPAIGQRFDPIPERPRRTEAERQ